MTLQSAAQHQRRDGATFGDFRANCLIVFIVNRLIVSASAHETAPLLETFAPIASLSLFSHCVFGAQYSHGENKFIGVANGDDGSDKFFLMGQVGSNEHATGYEYIYFFFQYVFAAHTSTIVGGAVTERCQLGAYFIYTFVIVGFIYPVVAHWVWAEHGWASAFTHSVGEVAFGGCIDFGGGAVVHLTGGMCALWGASVIGPRKGRYDDRGRLLPLPGHSSVLSVLGTLILWVCWYGFNPGSTLAISGDEGKTAARACVTTTLAGAGGGITVILLDKSIGSEVWEVSAVCNGVLAGLVSITAGCATVTSFSALFIGILGGAVYFLSSKLLAHKLKVDDPVDAFAVHGACGCFGVIANGFFADDFYTKHYYQWAQLESGGRPQWDPSYAGVFYGGSKVCFSHPPSPTPTFSPHVTLPVFLYISPAFSFLYISPAFSFLLVQGSRRCDRHLPRGGRMGERRRGADVCDPPMARDAASLRRGGGDGHGRFQARRVRLHVQRVGRIRRSQPGPVGNVGASDAAACAREQSEVARVRRRVGGAGSHP